MEATRLIADIGATNARFALAGPDGVQQELVLKCTDYPGLAEAMQAYLQQAGARVAAAAVAIAGPVSGDRFSMTNHPWSFSVADVKAQLGLSSLVLMNDFEALARAVPFLKEGADYRQVHGDKPQPQAPIGIIGPGTGLGVASLIWDGQGYRPVPGEGGHVTVPARSQRTFDLFAWLLANKYSHISAERVCSGKGLVNLYNGLRGLDGLEGLPDLEAEQISAQALSGACPVCAEALDMMMDFLGVTAGNLALTLGAFGGIYIAGGIPARLGDYFDRSSFFTAFSDKGRFRDYMAPIPVYLIHHPFPAFVGLQSAV
ncbi:MAG: glucokinase [Rhodospirillales bacterium]|nr:glucokinase [Rhodospirillales bacterium]MCB9994998.1 glucokinase [Rhodospirillales bacterium]